MKKILSTIMVGLLLVGVAACGKSDETTVSALTLSHDSLALSLFGQTELVATKTNVEGAVEWTNSNDNVLEMTQNGDKVTLIAKNAGSATISASVAGKTDECIVEVTDNGETLLLSSEWAGDVNLLVGGTLSLAPTVTFKSEAFTRATVSYEVDEPTVATVDENGVITAVAVGNATVTAVAEYFGHKSNVIQTNITVAPDIILKTNLANVELYEPSSQEEFISEKAFTAAIQDGEQEVPLAETDYTATSSAPTVAILENGKVKALSVGEAQITVSTVYKEETYTSVLHVTVSKIPTLSVELNKTELSLYSEALSELYPMEEKLEASVLVNGESNEAVVLEWSVTEGEDIVSVSEDGLVKALGIGTAKVTVVAKYSALEMQATCNVTVFDANVESMEFDGSVFSLMTSNGDTYAKEGNDYVFTKYSNRVTSGELKLDTTRMGVLFAEGNWVVVKLNASVATWLAVDVGGNYNYLGYTTEFEAVGNEKTVVGDGYAIYQIGSNGGISGETIYSSAEGSAETPVVFKIESVAVYTPEGFAKFKEEITGGSQIPDDTPPASATKAVFDGSIFSLTTSNGDTYEKVGDNYVFTKYSNRVNSGELKLNTARMGALFENGNWIVVKLNASVATWLAVDAAGNYNYLGYTTEFEAVGNEKTVVGDGYAIYQIGHGGVSGEIIYSSAEGSAETPVVFTIESVTVCTQEEFDKLKEEIAGGSQIPDDTPPASATKAVFDGSIFSLTTSNGDTYEKVGDNYVFTKYSNRVNSGELKLNTARMGALFAEGNWIVVKLNASVATWLAVDAAGNYNYLGYTTEFEKVGNEKTVVGDGYAIYQIGNNGGISGETIYSSAEGSAETPVVFTIESVTVCTQEEFDKLISAQA